MSVVELNATRLIQKVDLALPMVVVAFRLEGMPDIPRAAGALEFLAAVLRPPTDRPNRRSTS